MRRFVRSVLVVACVFGFIAANGIYGTRLERLDISEDSKNIAFRNFFIPSTIVLILLLWLCWRITRRLPGPSPHPGLLTKATKGLICLICVPIWIAGLGGVVTLTADAVVYFSAGPEFFEKQYVSEHPLLSASFPAGNYIRLKVVLVLLGIAASWTLHCFAERASWIWLLFPLTAGVGMLAGSQRCELNPKVGAIAMMVGSAPVILGVLWKLIQGFLRGLRPKKCPRCGCPLKFVLTGELHTPLRYEERGYFPVRHPGKWYCPNCDR